MSVHHDFSSFIWSIADLLRAPYRHRSTDNAFKNDALDSVLNMLPGQRFHNHSPSSGSNA